MKHIPIVEAVAAHAAAGLNVGNSTMRILLVKGR